MMYKMVLLKTMVQDTKFEQLCIKKKEEKSSLFLHF